MQRRAWARSVVPWGLGIVLASSCFAGCQTYSAELQRGQGYYEQNQYELALSLWRHLETERDSLDEREQVRYFYLRGMTDYRLEYREHAAYWLSLAQGKSRAIPGALRAAEEKRMNDALDDLAAGLALPSQPSGATSGSPEGAAPRTPMGSPPLCKWSSECPEGSMCWQGSCAAVE